MLFSSTCFLGLTLSCLSILLFWDGSNRGTWSLWSGPLVHHFMLVTSWMSVKLLKIVMWKHIQSVIKQLCCEFLMLSMWEILFKCEIMWEILIHNYYNITSRDIFRGFHCISVIIIIIHSVTFLPVCVYLSFIILYQDKFSLVHVVIFSALVLFT